MAMAAFAAKAEDVFPKWSDPTTWTDPKLLSDDLSPMRFVVVRSNATGCESNCPEWISAEGAIEAGTPAQLKRILKTLGRRKLPIIVNSPGGNVDAALQLGRIIRKNKLDIAVGTTKFSDCWPGMKDCRANDGKGAAYFGIASDGGAMCNSACPLMFAGGVGRVVGGWAYLGVHQITTTYFRTTRHYRTTYRVVRGKKYRITTETITQDNAGYKTYEMSKALERKLSAYLRDMGVGRGREAATCSALWRWGDLSVKRSSTSPLPVPISLAATRKSGIAWPKMAPMPEWPAMRKATAIRPAR
ncbi:hypothetical protein NKJ93_03215 [Mesorhizobium sp. M0028]|uniref:COG3904 family protein n=1 Tax=Mesorhizobium sp. M0028 TaxID=2956849 RepID=UPI00333BD8F9